MELPYQADALEPVMSKETIDIHFGKHYMAYLNNYNKIIESMPQFEKTPINDVILHSDGTLFNNAAQIVNHELFFKQLNKNGSKAPTGTLLNAINSSFSSFEEMRKIMTDEATTLFGSGWVWLSLDGDNLVITSGSNAYTPIAEGITPLLAIDVWEHSYYLDYQNRRAEYLEKLWDIIDWKVIQERYV